MKTFTVNGFSVTIRTKPAFEAAGFSRHVKLDGTGISTFLQTLTETGRLAALHQTGQPVWVCLSPAEEPGFDCRCTVCIETGGEPPLPAEDRYRFSVSPSDWADFLVNEHQSPEELHQHDVYRMVEEIGYTFNWQVGLHFDNEHDWLPGKTMHFLLPFIPR